MAIAGNVFSIDWELPFTEVPAAPDQTPVAESAALHPVIINRRRRPKGDVTGMELVYPPTRSLPARHAHQSRAMLGIVIAVLLGSACWAMILLVALYGPARHVAAELWPLALVPVAGLVARWRRAHLARRVDEPFAGGTAARTPVTSS
jgi:hypothetical protein